MNRSTVWTVLGVIAAIVIAWILVDIALALLWFIGKLVIVLIVAAVVFFVLRGVFSRRSSSDA
ncbi:MAG TPA: hypothetical protein VNT50_04400 [Microbacterium sp.]|uniref:hypothetical protein n=1 Tax=Microbacterium sp. TaxID=51671 RepID=UPI002B9C27BA|nr:hypothetical protein [Microbacterium sp.]HWI30706.1 hypothetical protein [Microbacterium sp.]